MANGNKTENEEDFHPLARRLKFLVSEKFSEHFIWLSVVGLVVTCMAGFIYPFKGHQAPWDFAFGSWAVFGFLSYCIVVLCADPLFKLLSRDEDYYGEGGDDD